MKKRILVPAILLLSCVITSTVKAQDEPLKSITPSKQKGSVRTPRCSTMEEMQEAIRKDPSLPEKWRLEGEKQYKLYLQRHASPTSRAARAEDNTIVIPIVFHLVDATATLNSISDRDIIEQVEILNEDYSGGKIAKYLNVIPSQIAARIGHIPLKFVLARRDPNGALTSGIERRAATTPDRVSIKSFATGGLDAWDSSKYLNIWSGTFSGSDGGLLGVSTFPFTTTEGPQGCVVGIKTLPYAGNTLRNYYPDYSEGATLSHEVGHYFYLWHTFGDETTCNNDDFHVEDGWPLPSGAGPEGDDTPEEKGTGSQSFVYGDPSSNYKDGCATESFGMMYGSFMNYFDDRALFMFSDGMRKRVEGCINLYRPGLLTTNGATPPTPVTDAFLVNLSPRGNRERKSFIVNNTPLEAVVRNNGTTVLSSVTLNVAIDAAAAVPTTFSLNLPVGNDTTLNLGTINTTGGTHSMTIYTSAPNGGTDDFLDNDTLTSFIAILTTSANLPFLEDFSTSTFPPTGWQTWNPNGGSANTWTRDAISGSTNAGSAFFDDYNINQIGTLDELITPLLDPGANTGVRLDFKVAYAVVDAVDVSTWDGLEVYASGDGGKNYHLVYKKTGNQLATAPVTTDTFTAVPSQQARWRKETVILTPYVIPGQKLIVKFRNINSFGNDIYLDDINIAPICASCTRDLQVLSIDNPAGAECTGDITPSITLTNKGVETITSFEVGYQIDNGTAQTTTISGVSIAQDSVISVPLPQATGLAVGEHTITAYTFNPVSSIGSGDLFPSNDTLGKAFGITGSVTAPLSEGFESTTFPPAGWVVVNPDASLTWQRVNAGSNSSASAYVNNYNYNFTGRVDDLYTPEITYSGVDSVSLSFDVAASGTTTGVPNDTLEVLITKDCGASFTSIYKKWGTALQTLHSSQATDFVPSLQGQWRTETIDLTTIAPTGPTQVIFRNTSNNQNNIYIDNVNFKTRILPARLKRDGLIIYPNPFKDRFTVWHLLPPTDLRYIAVYSATGQVVYYQIYDGNADKQETINLDNRPAGVYIVRLGYADANHNTSIRIVKF